MIRPARPARLLALLLGLALATSARSVSITPVGADLFSNPYDVEVSGTTAYVLYPSGLAVLDVTNSLRPEPISSTYLPGEAGDILRTGTFLYVTRGTGGLFTMDLTNPSAPEIVDTVAAPSSMGRIDAGAGRLYVADRDSGLIVFDAGDPASPMRLTKHSVGEPIRDLRIRRAEAYLATERGGVHVLDISHFAPVPLPGLPSLEDAEHLDVSFATLFVSRGGAGIASVDVSDSTNPVVLPDEYVPGGAIGDITVVDSFLVAVKEARELHLLKKRDLSSGPLAVSEEDTTLNRVFAAGRRVYSTSLNRGLQLFDLVIPQNATYVSSISLPTMIVNDVAVNADTAYLAVGQKGIVLVSLKDELSPDSLRTIASFGSVAALRVRNSRIYAVESGAGLRVYDVASGDLLGFAPTSGSPQNILLHQNAAYISAGSAGLVVADLSRPSTPVIVDSLPTGGVADRVTRAAAVSGDLLALAEGEAGIRLARVSDPFHPVALGSLETEGPAADVAFSGQGHLYVLLPAGILVLDVADPASPDSVGYLPLEGALFRYVEKLGEVLYVSEFRGQFTPGVIHVISIGDPSAPSELLTIPSQGAPGRITTGNERAYVASGSGGMEIFGTFESYAFLRVGAYDPYAPVEVVSSSDSRTLAGDRDGMIWPFHLQEGEALGRGDPLDLGGSIADILVSGQKAFVTMTGESLVTEVRLPTPDRVLLTRKIPVPGPASGLALKDSLLYVALGSSGLGVYNVARTDTVLPVGAFVNGGTDASDLGGAGAERVFVEGSYAYVGTTDRTRGLFILDVGNPEQPAFLSSFFAARRVFDVVADFPVVYLGERTIGGTGGLQILDVDPPGSPALILSRPDITVPRRIQLEEDVLFTARRAEGIAVYDVANRENPILLWQERTPESAWDFAILGTYLWEADGSSLRLYKQDFANADQTAPGYGIGVLSNPFANAFVDLVVIASEALTDKPAIRFTMGEVDSFLSVFRLDTPHNVYHSTYRLTETGTANVRVSGEDLAGNKSEASKAFTVSYVRGAKGGSIYAPSGKVEVRVPPRDGARNSYVLLAPASDDASLAEGAPSPAVGPFRISLGAADGPVSVVAFDVRPDSSGNVPVLYREEGGIWTPAPTAYDPSRRTATSVLPGSALFLFSYGGGGAPPAIPAVRLGPNRPNPFNPETILPFSLGREARVRLSVYDTAGRRVRTLVDRVLPAGDHEVVWDGRGETGRTAGSGIYFARVEAAGVVETRKLVLLR